MRYKHFKLFLILVLFNWGVLSFALPIFNCKDLFLNFAPDERAGWGSGTQSKAPKLATVSDRLEYLARILKAHPDIVSKNLHYKRNLLEILSHIDTLQKRLGKNAASLEEKPTQKITMKYLSKEPKVDLNLVEEFRKDREKEIAELKALLLPGKDLKEQLKHLATNDKALTKLFKNLPFLFDINGKYLAKSLNPIEQKPEELENLYLDLMKLHLSPLIYDVSEEKGTGKIRDRFQSFLNQFVLNNRERSEADKKGGAKLTFGEALKRKEDKTEASEHTLTLEELPVPVALARGCYGGDCAILSVPFSPVLKGVKAYFLYKGENNPEGYAIVAEVEADGKKVPYIITINGAGLTKTDAEMAILGIAKKYGSRDVVMPDFHAYETNHNLVNFPVIRDAMKGKKSQSVEVKLPEGWEVVDAYDAEVKKHLPSPLSTYQNYYAANRLKKAKISQISQNDSRLLSPIEIVQPETPRYPVVTNIKELSTTERALLAAQSLFHNEGGKIPEKEVIKSLDVTHSQVNAIKPLLEVSKARPLTGEEYKKLKSELGFSLNDILKWEKERAAATLKSLYEKDPSIFDEHRKGIMPKAYKEVLVSVFGKRDPQMVDKILEAKDIPEEKALKLLLNLRKAIRGDVDEMAITKKLAKGTSLEKDMDDAIRRGFHNHAYNELEVGRRLEQILNGNNSELKDLILKESLIKFPIQEFYRNLYQGNSIPETLSSGNVSLAAKAAFIRLHREYRDAVPEQELARVDVEIRKHSFIELFEKENEARAQEIRPQGLGQKAWPKAKSLVGIQPKETKIENVPTAIAVPESYEFIKIPKGKYRIGSPIHEEGRYDNEPIREVNIDYDVEVMAADVTQRLYEDVMGKSANRSSHKGDLDLPVTEANTTEDIPEFLSKLNARAKGSGFKYRMWTEEEYEVAARGGTLDSYSFERDNGELNEYGWSDKNSGNNTHRVASLKPNPLGIFDAHGNVWKWTENWYSADPTSLPTTDWSQAPSGSYRVLRGGSCYCEPRSLRSARHYRGVPSSRRYGIGFRLVRTPE